MENSKIAWTDHTFNPWWGCVKVSPGCANCYAKTWAERTGYSKQSKGEIWGVNAPRRFFSDKHWNGPIKWDAEAKAEGIHKRVFCASMADVFETHAVFDIQTKMSNERERLAELIQRTQNLDWLILTKRIERAADYMKWMFPGGLPDNAWIGCTAENQKYYDERILYLSSINASVRWISIEPQIGPITIYSNATTTALTAAIDWVICGGESGTGCRPFNIDWARSLRDECFSANIEFFMKQLGGHPDKRDNPDQWPEDIRVREFPR